MWWSQLLGNGVCQSIRQSQMNTKVMVMNWTSYRQSHRINLDTWGTHMKRGNPFRLIQFTYYTRLLEEQLESLTFCSIKISLMSQQRDETFAYFNIRSGIHRLWLKIDIGAKRNTFHWMFQEKLDPDFSEVESKNGTPIKCYGSISIPYKYNSSD